MYVYVSMYGLFSESKIHDCGRTDEEFYSLLLFTFTVTILDCSPGLGGAAPTLQEGLVPESV